MREQRVSKIIEYLNKNKVASLDELCNKLRVSKNTIRRDVNELIARGIADKVYGGILLSEKAGYANDNNTISYINRFNESQDAKRVIGELAARLVEDEDTIFIDSGTTTPYILPHLSDRRNLHIITNSLYVMNETKRHGIDTYCLGGIYMPKTDSFVGGLSVLEDVRITKAFMGASLVDVSGMTNFSYHEAAMKKAIINRAEKIIVVTAAHKFGRTATICFCPLNLVSVIVSDTCPPKDFLDAATQEGVELIYGKK